MHSAKGNWFGNVGCGKNVIKNAFFLKDAQLRLGDKTASVFIDSTPLSSVHCPWIINIINHGS